MPGEFDGAGSLYALGLRLCKLDADGTPTAGTDTCYVTNSLVQAGAGLAFTENEAVTQLSGRGQPCVSYKAADTLLNGLIDPLQVCQPDPNILGFLIGGDTILTPSEVQTVTITGAPAGGTFTLTYSGQTTATIAYNAASAAVQSALVALSTTGTGNVTVTGSAGGPYTVTFTGALAGTNVAALTADDSGLTGGTAPEVVVATSTEGGSGNAIGWRAPEVNTTPVPNGVAVEALAWAIVDNAIASVLPLWHHIWPRCRFRLSENFTLGAENAATPQFTATTEKNVNFGTGPVGDIAIPTDRVWQMVRTDNDWTETPGFITVA